MGFMDFGIQATWVKASLVVSTRSSAGGLGGLKDISTVGRPLIQRGWTTRPPMMIRDGRQ